MSVQSAVMDFGVLNDHAVGSLIKEAVRRGMMTARIMRSSFKATAKGKKSGNRTDWVTTADKKAQKVIVKKLRDWFPHFGIIGEESDIDGVPLRIPCTHPTLDIWFTIDPIDGTSAYVRRQSHGIGCMVSLVCNGKVICVCIGDIMTGEVYFFRPGSPNTHRIDGEIPEKMVIDPTRPLTDQYLLLRDLPSKRSLIVQAMIESELFRDAEVTGGSIGISMARLWKGEVGAALLSMGNETPWDSNPVIGMSLQLGFDFVEIDPHMRHLMQITPAVVRESYARDLELLVVHTSRRAELRAWCEAHDLTFI